jgi:hypothetical protein
VIDEWLLLEYAVVPFGANPEALVESVSKSGPLPQELLDALGIKQLPPPAPILPAPAELPQLIRHTSLDELAAAMTRRMSFNLDHLAADALDRARGRV